ncbi:MAG: hypothetical protein KGN77_12620 [Xanthomonadaceae bacterium]|nr:hypothetical protein [Xanthomonadaceae bacterium]MDE1963388.1 hypothetical protein [Xanthomonadaceae bacterium]
MTRYRTLATLLVMPLLAVGAARAQSVAPAPRPVLIQPASPQERFRQSVQQSQVRDQLQKGQLEHQLTQRTIESTRSKPGITPSNDTQVDKAHQAQDQLYDAQQRDRVQRYNDALMAQPVHSSRPANAGSH